MKNNNNKGVYIPSIEASDIHNHMARGNNVKKNYVGMIPYSLEQIKLREQDQFITWTKGDKEYSDDVINVKFNQKVRSGKDIIKDIPEYLEDKKEKINDIKKELRSCRKSQVERLNKELNKLKRSIEYYKQLQDEIDVEDKKWEEVGANDLRYRLYKDGFTITTINYDTGEVTKDNYLYFTRSTSKSRKGEALFIKEELYSEMINWSRMNMPLHKGQEIDLAGLSAYESLIMSGIEDIVNIPAENILIVDDVISSFDETVNLVKDYGNGLDSKVVENYKINNEIFDGQALLDSNYFNENEGMKLLRNHMFKAAAFSTNIQLFMGDYFGDNYETATVTDMFDNEIKVTDIKLIINPSCLKALKFADVVSDKEEEVDRQSDMYEWWKQAVENDGNNFGIVKHDKGTKLGKDNNDNPLQITSYQMLNSLPATYKNINKMSEYEKRYIMDLKNDDESFIKYLEDTSNKVNANDMFVDLYYKNPKIANTKLFRDFRKSTIKKYVEKVKKGKIKLAGDYVTLLSCPIEYLHHAVGEEITKPLALTGNEVCTTLFDFGKELTGFRNPHTAPSNVLKVKNTDNDKIRKYIALTDNIVVINTIGFNILNILSGADMDSDTMVLFDSGDMLELANKCFGSYYVCENGIPADKTKYHLTLTDMATLDNKLAESKTVIGEVVNLGQLAMSIYWDKLNNGINKDDKQVKELLKLVDIMTVLSGCAIDNAKRQYDIDIKQEIRSVRNQLELKLDKNGIGAKPNFWRYVHNDKHDTKDKKLALTHYDCPMDYLYEIMSNLGKANRRNPIKLSELLVNNYDIKRANRKQIDSINQLANDSNNATSHIIMVTKDEEEEFLGLDDVMDEFNDKFSKFKINETTMFAILNKINKETELGKDTEFKGNVVRLMDHLYKTKKTLFLGMFK